MKRELSWCVDVQTISLVTAPKFPSSPLRLLHPIDVNNGEIMSLFLVQRLSTRCVTPLARHSLQANNILAAIPPTGAVSVQPSLQQIRSFASKKVRVMCIWCFRICVVFLCTVFACIINCLCQLLLLYSTRGSSNSPRAIADGPRIVFRLPFEGSTRLGNTPIVTENAKSENGVSYGLCVYKQVFASTIGTTVASWQPVRKLTFS